MQESEKWKWSCSVVSDPQRTHGLQPPRLLHPWDFPGKSTGVGCHCLLQPANAGDIKDIGSVPGLGRSPGGGHGNPLQYCLENSMDRGAWRATVYRVTKSQTRLKGARTHLQNSRSLASLTTLSPHSLMSALSWNCPSIGWSLTIYTPNEVKAHPAPHSQDSYLLPLSPGCVWAVVLLKAMRALEVLKETEEDPHGGVERMTYSNRWIQHFWVFTMCQALCYNAPGWVRPGIWRSFSSWFRNLGTSQGLE